MKNKRKHYFTLIWLLMAIGTAQFLVPSTVDNLANNQRHDPSGLLKYFDNFEWKDDFFPSGSQSYAALNNDPHYPFVMSIGFSMSQTHQADNTANFEFIRKRVQALAKKLPLKKAEAWLKNSDRLWYILRSLPECFCENGHVTDPAALNPDTDSAKIDRILTDIARNRSGDYLCMTTCPECHEAVTERAKVIPEFTPVYERAIHEQIKYLNIFGQYACKMGLPAVRLSLEAVDVMVPGSTELSVRKLAAQAAFINLLGNPLLFFHHYANPQTIPNLFEKPEHADWFANYCLDVLRLSPQVTHVCPISQPLAFSFRVARGTLPPFSCSIDQSKYLENITNAQVKAAQKIKKFNPAIQILVSHQWKSMKPKHTSIADPRRLLEQGICKIARSMYNGKFVSLISPYMKYFDGIALSIYPALYFNLWEPEGDNCAGKIDFEAALEALVETSKAFSGKDIYVVETGCNTQDPDVKRQFIDMTLYACQVARDKGIPVKGVYFWGITNDKDFYCEWNAAPGATHFAPFEYLNPANPTESINEAGRYLRNILSLQN